jgi:hypothetical protein
MERMVARKLPHPPENPQEIGPLRVSPDGGYLLGAKLVRLGDEPRQVQATLPAKASFAGWGPKSNRIYFCAAARPAGREPFPLWRSKDETACGRGRPHHGKVRDE